MHDPQARSNLLTHSIEAAVRTIKAAFHETRCIECRVTWYSWLLRLAHIGGMVPMAKDWRRSVSESTIDDNKE